MAIHRNQTSEVALTAFEKDVFDGLSKSQKSLPSKYFYDQKGDELFMRIMEMSEYYLTNCEFEILEQQGASILAKMQGDSTEYDIYELGAGDGRKTIELLKHVDYSASSFYPIDISKNALDVLENNIKAALPNLRIKPQCGDYFEILHTLGTDRRKIILFLGSNLGNLTDNEASSFLSAISDTMADGDRLLLGLDLMKSRSIVLPAYNDEQGITRDFNLNLLARINREMSADFDLRQFAHNPVYDEQEGVAYSFLQSKIDQEVNLRSIDESVRFKAGELIHTEISRKYSLNKLSEILRPTSLEIEETYSDHRNYFTDYLLKKKL
jgi:dimethylhistidine N-methyltransferase